MKRFRNIAGFVTVGLQGRELSRFLRLCSHHDIFVWNIISVEWNQIQIDISGRDLLKTKEYLKKTKTHICYIYKRGFWFRLKKYKKNRMYLVGGIASMCLILWLSNYIWSIQVVGNSYISDEILREYLSRQGCGIGNTKNNVDAEILEKKMLRDFPEIIWNSVSIHGTTVHISVKEQIQNEEVENKNKTPMDLVAPMDGKVSSLYVRSGTAAVSLNQKVKKGDVLVYGWIPIYNDSGTEIIKYHPGIADGDVMVQGKVKLKHSMDNQYNRRIYSGKKRKYYYIGSNIGKHDFTPCFFGTLNTTKLIDTQPVTFLKTISLPLYINHITEREYEFCKACYSKKEINQRQNQFCNAYIKKIKEKGVQIIGKNVMITYGKKQSVMQGEIECRWPAADYVSSVIPDIENLGIENE